MDKFELRRVLVLGLGLLLFFFMFVVSKAEGKDGGNKEWIEEEEEDDEFEAPNFSSSSSSSSGAVQEVLMDAISLLTVTSSASPPPSLSYSSSLIRLIHRAQSYLFPPKLDFRGGVRKDADGDVHVKDAISKSMETSKVTVEDSAKSAADLATQTLLNTKDKLKKTFSPSSTEQDL